MAKRLCGLAVGWAEVIRQRSSEADSVLFVGVCVCVVTKHMRD